MAQLSGSFTLLGSSVVNLTNEGTADWTKTSNVAVGDFDHKATGGTQISDLTIAGLSSDNRFTNNPVAFSWGDGTPTGSFTGTAGSGIGRAGRGTAGSAKYSFTVKADTTVRTLKFYCGAFSGSAPSILVHLSDSSASDYSDSSLTPGSGVAQTGVYTITFAAGSASQTITVTWTMTADPFGNGNINTQAATLFLAGPTTDQLMAAINRPTSTPVFLAKGLLVYSFCRLCKRLERGFAWLTP